jgi:hypothetical protein
MGRRKLEKCLVPLLASHYFLCCITKYFPVSNHDGLYLGHVSTKI